jgi:glutamate dehydrogenase/leucine dehydrogenase
MNRKLKDSSAHPHLPFDDMMSRFWHLPADIFVPAAASKLITKAQVQSIIDSGVSLIACGANVPFADDANFFGDIAEYTDNQISVIPDFVANCGVARVFAYLMEEDGPVSEESIFTAVSTTVETALKKVFNNGGSSTRIAQSLYQQALEQLI